MLAKRKSDGKVIEVKPQRFMEQDGSMYAPSDLDFNVEEAEEVTIDGWVARDEDGKAYLHSIRPERGFDDDRNVGIWGNCVGHQMIALKRIFPSLTWKSDPIEVTITIKPKKI